MFKFPLGGSAAVAGSLLASSFLFFTTSSIAEPLQLQSPQQKAPPAESQKADPTATTLVAEPKASGEIINTAEVAKAAEANKNTASPTNTSMAAPSASSDPASGLPSGISPALTFRATAYSLYGRTASGSRVRKGIIAADRRVLPLGTRVRLEAGAYSGEYEVCDTGGAIRGKKIDLWMPTGREAMRFGRRNVKLTVLSYPQRRAVRAKAKAT
jgi:3D (Asp-Asp-Asp) domain-containing protein